jgi:hypothetical protein
MEVVESNGGPDVAWAVYNFSLSLSRDPWCVRLLFFLWATLECGIQQTPHRRRTNPVVVLERMGVMGRGREERRTRDSETEKPLFCLFPFFANVRHYSTVRQVLLLRARVQCFLPFYTLSDKVVRSSDDCPPSNLSEVNLNVQSGCKGWSLSGWADSGHRGAASTLSHGAKDCLRLSSAVCVPPSL